MHAFIRRDIMRIMISTDLAPPYIGGGESYVIHVASGMAKLSNDVNWLTSQIPGTATDEDYEGIKIHRVKILFSKYYKSPFVRLTYGFTSIPSAIHLAAKMDILQFNTFVAGGTGWLIAKVARKPAVLFCHEFFGRRWKFLGQNFFERYFSPDFRKNYSTHAL